MAANDFIKEELETLESSVPSKIWVLTDGEVSETFEQKPLSFFGKIEFFSLVGDVVDSMTDDGKALNINELFGATANIDNLVAVVSRVAAHTPEALQEAYCIFLGVPRNKRVWAKYVMEQNLTDDEGMEILSLFIDQNADNLRSFFDKKGKDLLAKVTKKFGRGGQAPSSKRSKRTPQATQA